ncbi:twin-arginine translocation signal domain-containing protein [Kaustia mangrovi]|uniref:twin-arginine translocation signal domain-containing protein n=1 Tax=Kaustia mangrovi TaxID=2593653 RepID=UPI001FED05FC|nr:twin-arginine translocation signal domain-containing protein [Kaustia mangrovi]
MSTQNKAAGLSRRRFLATSALAAGSLAMPRIVRAQEPEKPGELIVRAWGGAWGMRSRRG